MYCRDSYNIQCIRQKILILIRESKKKNQCHQTLIWVGRFTCVFDFMLLNLPCLFFYTWVEWKTLNASPAKKSLDERSPATGRRVKPVVPNILIYEGKYDDTDQDVLYEKAKSFSCDFLMEK